MMMVVYRRQRDVYRCLSRIGWGMEGCSEMMMMMKARSEARGERLMTTSVSLCSWLGGFDSTWNEKTKEKRRKICRGNEYEYRHGREYHSCKDYRQKIVVSKSESDRRTLSSVGSYRERTAKGLFRKLLVANRGEIAVRVMKTAKRLGIPTVAVYSEADRDAVHTRYADEAICIGPPPSTKSYLKIDSILESMQRTGADAVHPGYGFLSENAEFAKAVERIGATFVGPSPHALAAMGDKVESKKFAREAGVNTIPGWAGVIEGADHAISVARDIGFPVMIKASAGGGGKGMRIAWSEKELLDVFELATQEAASAFGDSRMLIEKYVEKPRHIEIQVLGDKHGNVIYLPERECSIQRRNQKVIEEAPSPVATPELRAAMGKQAVALSKAVEYFSAGTCEFLVDKDLNFYFLEMNTRLQVEHPITEYVTGLDLVEEMLNIAAGHPLRISQEQVANPSGWAVECRVYAEDPARGFLPSIGTLERYVEPSGEGVRVDSGVREGSEISIHYDPMICKLIGQGPDRKTAIRHASKALDSYIIRGVQHNAPLLRSVLQSPDFIRGDFSTYYLSQHFPKPEDASPLSLPLAKDQEEEVACLAAAVQVWYDLRMQPKSIAQVNSKFKMESEISLYIGNPLDKNFEPIPITIRPSSSQMVDTSTPTQVLSNGFMERLPALEAELPNRIMNIVPRNNTNKATSGLLFECEIDGDRKICQVISRNSSRQWVLQYCGAHRCLSVDMPEAASKLSIMPEPPKEDLSKVIKSPMPGVLVSISVSNGDTVDAGDEVAVIEAMKMRNQLKAIAPGKVISVNGSVGSSIAADEIIVQLE